MHPLCSIVLEEDKQNVLKVLDVNDNRCRYHPLRNKHRGVNITSQGMCPLAYSNLYPTLFALHCNQDRSKLRLNPDHIIKQCPLGSDGVSFNVYTTKIEFELLKYAENVIRKLINLVIPSEIHNKNIVMEVVAEGKGCPLGMKKGDTYLFNIDSTDKLCPAAFYSVYPFLNLNRDGLVVGCPDYQSHVRFAPTDNIENTVHVESNKCDYYTGRVKIIHTKGDFLCPIKVDRWYSVDELIAEVGIKCYTSFHVAFPYLYVLNNGGQLGYLTRDRMKAGICCPNASFSVRYIVSKDPAGNYRYDCTRTHDECPRKIALNEEAFLHNFEETLPFYAGLSEIYTIFRKIESCKVKDRLPLQTEILSREEDSELLWLISRGT